MDIELNYTQYGKGDVLLLLHGNGEDSSYFVHQIECFSKYFKVIAVDTRGHGKSPRGSAPFTIRQFARDLLELMDTLEIEKANILGFSDGGNIALVFALAYPERVKHLILNGANLSPDGVRAKIQLPIELSYRIWHSFSHISPTAKHKSELLGLMVNDPNIPPRELTKLRCPTLVIAGTDDMIKHRHTRLIAALIPGSKLVFIKGDHFIAHETPRPFNRAVLNFLLK